MNKALLIGVNKYENVNGLAGCVNDVADMEALLVAQGAVEKKDVTCLLDEEATREKIAMAITSHVASAKPGDHIYVHFSGHGVQVPSDDPQEPDGADEVLCPYDFNWSPASSITDDQLRDLLNGLSPRARLTLTVDACHSGDYSRGLRGRDHGNPRTPIPPAAIAARLASSHRVRRLRSFDSVGNVAVISACRSWETAKDTSFDNRPAGAFTHFFQTTVSSSPDHKLEEIVSSVLRLVATFSMHPVAEGSRDLRSKPYIPRAHGIVLMGTHPLPRSLTTLWEHCWNAEVYGQRGDVAVAITIAGNDIVAHVRTQFFGGGEWHVDLTGNALVPLDLGLGVQLRLATRDWVLTAGNLRFELWVELYSPFIGSIPIGVMPVSVRVDSDLRIPAHLPQSAADFMALMALHASRFDRQTGTGKTASQLVASRAPGEIVYMAAGDFGWGPNWREDRTIEIGQRARTVKRDSVVFDPVRGGGYVQFLRWRTDDERDPSFVVHIGNGFFGGWGSVHYTVQGIYESDVPFPELAPRGGDRTETPRNLPRGVAGFSKSNGQSRPVEQRPDAFSQDD